MNERAQRLDRFLSGATGLSRRLIQQAIRAGHVSVDGVPSTDPSRHIHAAARVQFRDEIVTAVEQQYWMLHKPSGVVCATHDGTYRTVIDCVKAPAYATLHIAGRLDIDATGLVLLTDDGDWSHRVTSPRYDVAKVYCITLQEPLSDSGQDKLRAGIALKGEPKPCQPAVLEKLSDNRWRVTVTEGKYHQVKRMFAAIGNHVAALHRERIGAIVLDPALAPGESRPLTAEEVSAFAGNVER